MNELWWLCFSHLQDQGFQDTSTSQYWITVSFAVLKHWEGDSGEIVLVPGAHKRFYVTQFLLESFEVGGSY